MGAEISYLICKEDHYTKDFPRRAEVSHLLKGTLAVLKEPFPSQQTQLVDQPQSSASSRPQVYMMMSSFPTYVATRFKDYQTPQKQKMEKETTDIPSTSTPPSSIPLYIERHNNEYII